MRKSIRMTAIAVAAASCCSFAMAKSAAEWQQLVQQSRITLPQALEHATKTVPGTVLDASLDDGDQAPPRYEVEVLNAAGENVEVWVDAATGAATLHKNEGPAKNKDKKRVQNAKTSMTQAIQAAINHTPGTPVSAELDDHWGKTSYQVDVLQANGGLMEVKINAADGSVLRAKPD